MKFFHKANILIILLTLTAAKCELPDVNEYADLTKEMSQSIRQTATQTIDLLGKGYYARSNENSEIDPTVMDDLNEILGNKRENIVKNYPEILLKDWKIIFNTLEQMVNYADALAAITESGSQGKESFGNLANSLSGLASAAGFGTISVPIQQAGQFVYGKIAEIKASKKLEDVIVRSDTVIQMIAKRLDSAIENMKEVNNVAESENLLNLSGSKDNERIRNYFQSLLEKEKVNMEKLTLINTYDNGDRSALVAFVYRDPQSLDKLGIKDLQTEIRKIQENGELSPREKLEAIATMTEEKFETEVGEALNNYAIVNSLIINQRLRDIQDDLQFVRNERIKYQSGFEGILESGVNIKTAANVNREFIEKSRKAVKTWALQHHNLRGFFDQKQSLSYSTLRQYVEDVQELGLVIKNINNTKNATTNDTP